MKLLYKICPLLIVVIAMLSGCESEDIRPTEVVDVSTEVFEDASAGLTLLPSPELLARSVKELDLESLASQEGAKSNESAYTVFVENNGYADAGSIWYIYVRASQLNPNYRYYSQAVAKSGDPDVVSVVSRNGAFYAIRSARQDGSGRSYIQRSDLNGPDEYAIWMVEADGNDDASFIFKLDVHPIPNELSPGNDYPEEWDDCAAADEYKFYQRNCTSYVGWRINSAYGYGAWGMPYYDYPFHNHTTNISTTPHLSHARYWDERMKAVGYKVDDKPQSGAIAQWEGPTVHGHVAYVDRYTKYSDGREKIVISEYNWSPTCEYGTRTIWSTSASWPDHFIHVY